MRGERDEGEGMNESRQKDRALKEQRMRKTDEGACEGGEETNEKSSKVSG